MSYPKVSVIVPGHDCSSTIKDCLSSLRSQDWPMNCLEILYVDDASRDNSVEVAAELADRIERIAGEARGPSAARNVGAQIASGEILVFCDSDVVMPAETIKGLMEPLLKEKDVVAVFGSYDSEPSGRSLVSQYRNLMHHFVHQNSRRNAATFWAGCGAIRKKSFDLVGGFDEKRYGRAAIEDIELGHRMRARGMQIRLRPSVQVKHLKEWTLHEMLRTDIFLRGIPWMRLLFQDPWRSGEIGDLNLKVTGVLSVVLAWLAAFMLLLSIRLPKLIHFSGLAFLLLLLINLPTYVFFWRIRSPWFAIMIVPLNIFYHLYNGISVVAALLYRVLIDKPLPGLKAVGAVMQRWYWNYLGTRYRRRSGSGRNPSRAQGSDLAGKGDLSIGGTGCASRIPATDESDSHKPQRREGVGLQSTVIVKPGDHGP